MQPKSHPYFSFILHPLLKLLNMAEPASGIEFFPDEFGDTVDSYIMRLQKYETRQDMIAAQVTAISLVKAAGTASQREYLVISAKDVRGHAGYIVFERFGGGLMHHDDNSSQSLSQHRRTRSLYSSSLPSPSLKDQHARDKVTTQQTLLRHLKDRVISEITFSSNQESEHKLHLYHIAYLAKVTRENKKVYRLLSSNCYWFANFLLKLMAAAVAQFQEAIAVIEAQVQELEEAREQIEKLRKERART